MYYFPTSTLNFSSLISSQRILPSQCYDAKIPLWWNHYELSAFEKTPAVLVLFNRFPRWEVVREGDRDEYPLVISFEDTVLPSSRVRQNLKLQVEGTTAKALLTAYPLDLSVRDILLGKIRFFFRNEEELRRIVEKAEGNTEECKVLAYILSLCPTAFGVFPKASKRDVHLPFDEALVKQFSSAAQTVLEKGESNETILNVAFQDEREKGAELGYELGCYVRSLRNGFFCEAFRRRIEFSEWKDVFLPDCFRKILNRFTTWQTTRWDPNRSAILTLLEDVREDFERDFGKNDGGLRDFRELHEHWRSAEHSFWISKVEDPYLQAFAAFLECGANPDKYPRFLKKSELRSPEFMLVLYGAIVGYTEFSRKLLGNGNYLPPPPKQEPEGQSSQQKEAQKNNKVTKPSKAKNRNEGQCPPSFRQGELFSLFIDDPTICTALCDFVQKELEYDDIKMESIKKSVEFLQQGYRHGGMFAENAEQSPRDNESTLRHFLNLISKSTSQYFVASREGDDIKKIGDFLGEKYGCSARPTLGSRVHG